MAALEIICGFIFIVLAILSVFYSVSVFNGLIQLKNNVDKSWANIDVLLKQRSDLIPNLVETVKGYMKHEKEVLTTITKLRTDMVSSNNIHDLAKNSEAISGALKSIFAVSENYPKLMASNNFLKLQEQLSLIENSIADRREFYNDSVLLLNTRIHSFPDTLVAMFMGMKDKEYFKATEEEKKTVSTQI